MYYHKIKKAGELTMHMDWVVSLPEKSASLCKHLTSLRSYYPSFCSYHLSDFAFPWKHTSNLILNIAS